MPNVIPNGNDFSYRGRCASTALELHRWLQSISDNLANRIASHRYLKRDGAEQEPMGAGDGTFRFRLSIVGDDCAARYRSVVQYLRTYPQGTLVHPLLGEIRVASFGVEEGSLDVVGSFNRINVSLRFSEDALDSAIGIDQTVGPDTAAGSVTANAQRLNTALSSVASVAALVAAAVDASTALVSTALDLARNGTANAGLAQQVGAVDSSVALLVAAVLVEPSFRNDADRFGAIDAAVQLRAAAYQLADAVASMQPSLSTITVAQTAPLFAIAGGLYSRDLAARADQLRALNAIATPHAVPAGTLLLYYLEAA